MVRHVILALSVAALLSPVARAADPKTRPQTGTPAKKEKPKTPAPLPPSAETIRRTQSGCLHASDAFQRGD
jgi:hypothetical protein